VLTTIKFRSSIIIIVMSEEIDSRTNFKLTMRLVFAFNTRTLPQSNTLREAK